MGECEICLETLSLWIRRSDASFFLSLHSGMLFFVRQIFFLSSINLVLMVCLYLYQTARISPIPHGQGTFRASVSSIVRCRTRRVSPSLFDELRLTQVYLRSHQVLADLHGHGDLNNPLVLLEHTEIAEAVQFDQTQAARSFKDLFGPGVFRRVVLGCSIQAWGQLTGMNVMMYYIV